MAKITAPLFGFRASGSIAKTLTYSTWKGQPIARAYAVPTDRNTPAQQTCRTRFAQLAHAWNGNPLTFSGHQKYNSYASITSYRGSGYNLFVSHYITHDPSDWLFLDGFFAAQPEAPSDRVEIVCGLICDFALTEFIWCFGRHLGTADHRIPLTTNAEGVISHTIDFGPDDPTLWDSVGYAWLEIEDGRYLFSGGGDTAP